MIKAIASPSARKDGLDGKAIATAIKGKCMASQ
jgi:hypothetical protein